MYTSRWRCCNNASVLFYKGNGNFTFLRALIYKSGFIVGALQSGWVYFPDKKKTSQNRWAKRCLPYSKRDLNPHSHHWPKDFKSFVSTDSTIRATSGKRDSNSRPQPWQGCALPTELFPQNKHTIYMYGRKVGAKICISIFVAKFFL